MEVLGYLREIEGHEVELMREWRNAPEVRMNMYTRHVISVEEHFAWWQRTKSRADQKFFIYEFAGRPSGIVGFTEIDRYNRNASWAFYAAPGALKGTGSRMEYLALEFAFNQLDLHKLNCEVLAYNAAVIGLHRKFAFEVEGVLREQHLVDGAFVDVHKLGLLSQDWAAHRAFMREKLEKLSKGQK